MQRTASGVSYARGGLGSFVRSCAAIHGKVCSSLYEHIDDLVYLAKGETFKSWYENPIDLPGRWYLQVIQQFFKESRLSKGTFDGLGRRLNLRNIACPVYLLAGASYDITTPEQVLGADQYLGTPKADIVKKTVPGGHIGLFMGARTLKDD